MSARVTEVMSVVTVLPPASWIVTAGWVPKATRLVVGVLGWVVKASLLGAPAVMLKFALVPPESPEAVAVSV